MPLSRSAAFAALGLVTLLGGAALLRSAPTQPLTCDPEDGGLVVAEGFCALVVADDVGAVRHLVVAANGDVFAAVAGRTGGVLALRDTTGDGKADLRKTFGPAGGTGIALHGGYLYFAPDDRVLRYPWAAGQLEPAGDPEVVIRDLPVGGHRSKNLAFGADGALYLNVGSRTNSCQVQDRTARSPGQDPCTELETRAGIWRFDPTRLNQTLADGTRYATGLRNAMGLAVHPETGDLYATTHGRDQLSAHWGFSDQQNAENPSEEFAQIRQGTDIGWPYCYHDPQLKKKVLAPEYGGDGSTVGRCAQMQDPVIGFPAHWAPNALTFYPGTALGARFRGGAFIAFHGSWNRAPLPQAGYRVVFVPFADGKATGTYETFATSRRGATDLRASGVAVGPRGSLYIAADGNRTIWRVQRR